jgi:hypothetical protein
MSDLFFAGGALHVAADVLVEFVQAAHHLAHVFVSLGYGQGRREILVGFGGGDKLVRCVNLTRKFVRLLLFDFAECFEQGKGVVRQGDGLAVVSMLLALDPTGFFQATDEIGSVVPFGFLTCERNGIRLGRSLIRHISSNLALGFCSL